MVGDMAWLDGRDPGGTQLPAPTVGSSIPAPYGEYLGMAEADGVQMYSAREVDDPDNPGATKLVWKLDGPSASLTADGQEVGHHDVGPVWSCYADNSVVKCERVDPPDDHGPQDIPWLLLERVSASGEVMGRVRFVQRVETHGGVPIQEPQSADETTWPPYSATYLFWGDLPDLPDTAQPDF
jgi:hypothetical protein